MLQKGPVVHLKALCTLRREHLYGCVVGDAIRLGSEWLELWQRSQRVAEIRLGECQGAAGVNVALLALTPTLVVGFEEGKTELTVSGPEGVQFWTVLHAMARGASFGGAGFFGDIECKDAADRLLRSSQTRMDEVYGPFYKLVPALELASKLGSAYRVWSRESPHRQGGARDYFVATVDEFWNQVSREEPHPFAYEVIGDNRPVRLFLDIEYAYTDSNPKGTGFGRVVCLTQLLTYFLDLNFPQFKASFEWTCLESDYESKFSQHLIWNDVVFSDIYALGRFMGAFMDFVKLQSTRADDDQMMARLARQCMVDDNKFIVDMGVYSKNRNFRLVYSSKLGKNSPLLPLGTDPDEPRSVEWFLLSLIVPVTPAVAPYLQFGSTASPMRSWRIRAPNQASCSGHELPLMSKVLDDFVKSIISPHGGYIRSVLDLGNDRILLSIAGGYRFCANVGRMHKSNNVMFIADMRSRKLFQRCYDPDCKQFESAPVDIPGALIETFVQSGTLLPDDVLLKALGDCNQ